MNFLGTALALLASSSVVLALPGHNAAQISCAVREEQCVNGTVPVHQGNDVIYPCCVSLKCGSNARCYSL